MFHPTELPEPSPSALAVSGELRARILHSIDDAAGHIGFDEYMRMALYEPGLGYYLAGAVKFGGAGDFVTAPELSPLFGGCIARQCQQILATTGGHIVEFGAGSGLLAAHILNELDALESRPQCYSIVELSPALRERQHQTLEQHAGALVDTVQWLDRPPETCVNGAVIANEILDSFPVKIFKTCAGQIYERRVRADGESFTWLDVKADPALADRVRHLVRRDIVERDIEYISEINVGVEPWIADLERLMGRAVALVIDYGFPRVEYYHPHRTSGTLMCHFRHRKHDDPFRLPGLEDITASVDFTGVAEAADASALQVLGFAEQSSFLLANGLLEDAEQRAASADEAFRQRVAHDTKILTLPTEMGARFKVLALGKDYTAPLRGFQLRDDRHRL